MDYSVGSRVRVKLYSGNRPALDNARRPGMFSESVQSATLRNLLGDMQQEFLVILFHFSEELAQLRKISSIITGVSPCVGVCRAFELTNRCRGFAFMKELVHRHFQGSCHLFEIRNCRDRMPVFNARNVAAKQPCPHFNVALRKFL